MAQAFGAQVALIALAATILARMAEGADLNGTLSQAITNSIVLGLLGLVCGALAGQMLYESARAEFDRWLKELPDPESQAAPE